MTVMKDQYLEDSKVQMSPLRRTTHVKVITCGWFNLAIKLVFVQSFIHTMSLICFIVSIYSFALFVPLFTLHLNPFSELKLYKIFIKAVQLKGQAIYFNTFIGIKAVCVQSGDRHLYARVGERMNAPSARAFTVPAHFFYKRVSVTSLLVD